MTIEAVRPRVVQAWGDAAGLDVLALGYASPFLPPWPRARRVAAAMPAEQGAHPWPAYGRNACTLAAEGALPFAGALFDRVLLAHLLEEARDVGAALREAERVLAPTGRILCVAACRSGVWARARSTPFAQGRAFGRSQLCAALRAAGLEPQGSARVLFAPPHPAFAPAASVLEAAGAWLRAPVSGLVMVEAVKRGFAVRPKARRAAPARARPVLVQAAAHQSPHRPRPLGERPLLGHSEAVILQRTRA